MPNIRFLSILLNEKYMAFFIWLFAIYCPKDVLNYSLVFKVSSIYRHAAENPFSHDIDIFFMPRA